MKTSAFVREFLAHYPKAARLRFKECPTCSVRWHVAFNMATEGPDVVITEEFCSEACAERNVA